MIRTNTVFVVGAGASVPFEFPSGRDLLRKHKDMSVDALKGILANTVSAAEARQLHEALRDSEDDSIDALLEFRPDLEPAGKTLMAVRLLACEQKCWEKAVWDGDWIQHLLALMSEDANSVQQFCEGNAVTFITYNYDRLVEYKLQHHLRAKWRAGPEQWRAVELDIPIIHLHGSLGALEAKHGAVPFGGILNPGRGRPDPDWTLNCLTRAAQSIRIVHQVADNDPAFRTAREALAAAETVVFLGFGFGRANVQRLDFSRIAPAAKILATRYGVTDQEYQRYCHEPLQRVNLLNQLVLGCRENARHHTWDCLQLLREHRQFLN